MRSRGGAMSLLFNNFFVNYVFPTPLPPEISIENRCFSETFILYNSFYVNIEITYSNEIFFDILKVALLFL